MITLYQLSISHYCEKIRWALVHKGLEHQTESLLPGAHAIKMKRMGLKSALPVLRDGDKVIQNSSDIVTYLDHAYPERPLTPADPRLAREAVEWERWADEEIGPHVRRICYHQMLNYPDIVVPLLSHGSPWYGRTLLRWGFPKIREKMRESMRIDDTETRASEETLDAALDKLRTATSGKEHLVGDRFSRADLAAAALLAPLRMPEKYGVPWPRALPDSVTSVLDRYADRLTWVDATYAKHR